MKRAAIAVSIAALLLAPGCSSGGRNDTEGIAESNEASQGIAAEPSPSLDRRTVERVNDICRGAEEKILDVGTDLIPSARAPESLIVDPAASVSYAAELTKLYLGIVGRAVHAGKDLPLPLDKLTDLAANETQLMLDYAHTAADRIVDFELVMQIEDAARATHEFAQNELVPLTGCWDLSVWRPSSCVWLAEGDRFSGCFGIYEASGEKVEYHEKDRDED